VFPVSLYFLLFTLVSAQVDLPIFGFRSRFRLVPIQGYYFWPWFALFNLFFVAKRGLTPTSSWYAWFTNNMNHISPILWTNI